MRSSDASYFVEGFCRSSCRARTRSDRLLDLLPRQSTPFDQPAELFSILGRPVIHPSSSMRDPFQLGVDFHHECTEAVEQLDHVVEPRIGLRSGAHADGVP
jgi:hypothetical protein